LSIEGTTAIYRDQKRKLSSVRTACRKRPDKRPLLKRARDVDSTSGGAIESFYRDAEGEVAAIAKADRGIRRHYKHLKNCSRHIDLR